MLFPLAEYWWFYGGFVALVLALLYGGGLWGFQAALLSGSPAEGLLRVVQLLVAFNGALLLWAVIMSAPARFRRLKAP